jgi:magnesium-transporting ATPase (P-type)
MPCAPRKLTILSHNHEPETRQEDLWAWAVGFVITLGLHVAIVVFTTLWVALAIYSLATTVATTSLGIQGIAWLFTVISLLVWARLVKQQILGFRPHTIRGLGRVNVVTSGCEWGEIAADLGAGLIGLAQIVPLVVSVLGGSAMPERTQVLTALVGGLFVVLGGSSLGLRLWLRRRQRQDEQNKTS